MSDDKLPKPPLSIGIMDLGRTFLRRDGEFAIVCSLVITPGTYRVRAGGEVYCVYPNGKAASHTRKHDLVSRTDKPKELNTVEIIQEARKDTNA